MSQTEHFAVMGELCLSDPLSSRVELGQLVGDNKNFVYARINKLFLCQ